MFIMFKIIFNTVLILLIGISGTKAQNDRYKKLDNYFKTLVENNKFMGHVYVSRGGKELYNFYGGYVDIDKRNLIDANTRYRVGSISKTYTATLILLAVEQGKLQLTQTLDKFFPEIPNASKITIADLLSHRIGIFNFTSNKDFLTWHTRPHSRSEMEDIIAKGGSSVELGAQMG